MKKNIYFSALIIFMLSCSKNDEIINQPSSPKSSQEEVDDKNRSARIIPAGDPNLNLWDWTTPSDPNHEWKVYFNNSNGTIGSASTLNPFVDGAQKVFGNSNPSKADMYPNQGWMLVSRDFGTPTSAPEYPFIILYNKHRGVLRVCVFRPDAMLSSYQLISLSFANASMYPNVFKFASNPADLAIGNATNQFYQSALTYAGLHGWMVAEFNLQGYSPVIDDFAALVINISEVVSSDISLSGSIQLDGTAEPQVDDINIWNGSKILTSLVASAADPIAKYVSKPTKVSEIAGGLTGGASTVLKSIIDAVSSFSGGDAGSTYNIKLNGTVTQTGTMKITSPKQPFSILLKPLTTGAYHALQTIPWGVYDVKPLTIYTKLRMYRDKNGTYTEYNWTVPRNTILLGSNLIIRPEIQSEITSINVGLSGQPLVSLDTFNAQEYTGTSLSTRPNFIDIQIKFTSGALVYQKLPLTIVNQ